MLVQETRIAMLAITDFKNSFFLNHFRFQSILSFNSTKQKPKSDTNLKMVSFRDTSSKLLATEFPSSKRNMILGTFTKREKMMETTSISLVFFIVSNL